MCYLTLFTSWVWLWDRVESAAWHMSRIRKWRKKNTLSQKLHMNLECPKMYEERDQKENVWGEVRKEVSPFLREWK
jgi:hypothetical protein